MNILALDCGTKTGWAIYQAISQANIQRQEKPPSGMITSGVQDFSLKRGESTGMQLLRFEKWLKDMIMLTGIEMIVYETAHVGQYASAIISLQSYITALILYCEKQGIECEPVEPKVIKKRATGKGNANKKMMLKAAQALFGNQIKSEDEADALLILDWAREEF